MRPDANTAWFTFSSKSDPPGGFGVYAFSGKEAVCEPYEFEIELVSRSANVDIEALTGAQALLSIADRSGEKRLVHGIIRHMEQRHTANAFTHYKCWLVPRLWFLDQISDHRIFQNLSVDGIIQKILREQGFTAEQYAFKLCYKYEPREYCVQYGETDLHFITRLCEEEGIYFYFEHTEDVHRLCFCDREGGPNIAGEWDIRFFPGSGQAPDTAVINRLHLHYGVNSNASMYREWNFQTPKIDLTSREREPDAQKAPTPPGMLLEQYQYPHLYEDRQQGERYAKLQLGRQLTFVRWIECQSDVSRWLPSYVFNLHEHPREDVNGRWWIVRVLHEGKQPGVLEHEAPDGRGQEYQSAVQAIPDMTRFIPPLEHPKNLVKGQQTAIVTGPDGEEIYVDKYGRVKVQFFWDREGQWDEKTTCWIRVSQGWAGGQYGGMAIPRIGHEVIVSFL
ncbi:MAG: type VI secretion system tip protein VgrG, partial [Desulfovibrio sp.]|nr:type VI secretion system tip protein VgrG [Desulfovibrio sp.]